MKTAKKIWAFLLAVLMVVSCFATMSLGIVAEEGGEAVEETDSETSSDLIYEYNFSKYTETVGEDFQLSGHNHLVVDDLANNGYATFTAIGADPFVGFGVLPSMNTSLLDYVVIKYRSTVTSEGQFMVSRTDGVNMGDAGSAVTFSVIGDEQWHVAVVDASQVWGNVTDVQMSAFRIDPFNIDNGSMDIAYIKLFATPEGAQAQYDAELVTTHLKGELNEGDKRIVQLGDAYYTAEEIIPLKEISKVAVDAVFPGDYSALSICCDALYVKKEGKEQETLVSEVANVYIRDEMGGRIVDADGSMEYFSFYGWVNPTGVEIASFGYQLNDMEPVFNDEWYYHDEELCGIIGDNARRFKNIVISTSDLPSGTYNVYPLMKDTNGVVYHLNTWGPIQFIKAVVDEHMNGDYMDDEGNLYTVCGNYLYANGKDTGLTVITDSNGKTVAYKNAILLTYQDPMAGAIEINGRKYIYDTRVAVTPVTEPVLPEDNSAVATLENGGINIMAADSMMIFRGDEGTKTMQGNLNGQLIDIDGDITTIEYFGWANPMPEYGAEVVIEAFGYQFNDMEPVFNSDWVYLDESLINLPAAGDGDTVRRYQNIVVDTASLPEGRYNLYLLVKDTAGNIYRLNAWKDLTYIKGGSWKTVGYTDGSNSYAVAEDGSISKNGETVANAMISEINGQWCYLDGIVDVTDGLEEGAAKGKYIYDVTLTYVQTPSIPLVPAEILPVYIVDGEALNTQSTASETETSVYSYENGYITYTSTGGDPRSASHLVPAGTTLGRYMVIRYRTSASSHGEVFVGSGTDATSDSNVSFQYVQDGNWHYVVVDLFQSADFDRETCVVNHFRNDYLRSADSIDIEYYAFFNNYDEAVFYAEENLHVLPEAPAVYIATFIADDQVVGTVEFVEGTTSINAPAVPEKEGYTGVWEEYTLSDADITIKAVYTEIAENTDPESQPEAQPETQPETGDAETNASIENPETNVPVSEPITEETQPVAEKEGCKSVIGTASVLALTALAGVGILVARKKKES